MTEGEIVLQCGPYVRVRLDAGGERWCRLREHAPARPGQRVRLQPGPAFQTAVPTIEVHNP